MVCEHCGAQNSERATYCGLCGTTLVDVPAQAPAVPAQPGPEFTLAPSVKMSAAPSGTLLGRTLGLGLVVTLVVGIPLAVMGRSGGEGEVTGAVPVMVNPEAREAIQQMRGGQEPPPDSRPMVIPNPAQAIGMANDARRVVNIRRIQMVLEKARAENDDLPPTLDEIPPGMLDFPVDPAIYHYTPVEPAGYRLEVVLQNPDAFTDDPNVKDGKYIVHSYD